MLLCRRTPLAWKNLTHDRRRLLIAVCGIGFAVVLMFMETGFENGLFDSTVAILQQLRADLIIASRAEDALLSGETFSRQRIYQARGCPGVAGVYPLYMEIYRALWRSPEQKSHPIRILGFHLRDPIFRPGWIDETGLLRQPCTALYDLRSKSKFGVPGSLDELLAERGAELSNRSIRLVGTFELGTDFVTDGNLILSADDFARYCPHRVPGGDPLAVVDLGIVQVQPGVGPQTVQESLRRILPDDVAVHTKQEFISLEKRFWAKNTPVGYVFFLGTLIGFLVGVIICYQIIYADIADHMAEFATLKAMGYRNRYFVGFVLAEALWLSVLSFLPGLLISLLLYRWLAWLTGLVMVTNLWRAGSVFLLTAAMCVLSGCLAMRKVMGADPAELF